MYRVLSKAKHTRHTEWTNHRHGRDRTTGKGETEGGKEGREEAAVVKTTGKDSRSGEREKEGGREGGKKRRGQMKQE